MVGVVHNPSYSGSVLQRHGRLAEVVRRWGAVHDHQRLGQAAERVLHELRQFVVSVRDVLLPPGGGLDHIAQSGERLVQLDRFPFLTPRHSRPLDPLGSTEITQKDLAAPGIRVVVADRRDLECANQMRTGTRGIHSMTRGSSAGNSRIEVRFELGFAGGLDLNQVLHLHRSRAVLV